ncbi:sugar nucleotide-binding protein [Glycomyces sp. A-F 0318]|uniref:SDR family oxidoreductase n=1 Tax=Glycomyces amatae TaxID=2881355 RepID=UPI001E4779C0|nr:sugar nucleotide-binding protein [Glycomyces amatae]MCD0445906.1 sugar nucleotide-binding protein [Glycomyces amatae]
MRLLIIGASGYLGRELLNMARECGHVVVGTSYSTSANGLMHLDVRDRRAFAQIDADFMPDAVINAAYRQDDWATTALAPIGIAAECAASSCRFIQVSSDAVFSGGGRDAYDETCPPAPATPYGAAKAAAEAGIAEVHPAAAIVRTSWIVGDGRSPFEQFVGTLARGEGEGVLFTDDVRCPVHVTDLACALLELCELDCAGVLHVAGADVMSRYDLGCLLAKRDGLDAHDLPQGTRGHEGATVRLDSAKARGMLSTQLRGAQAFATASVR